MPKLIRLNRFGEAGMEPHPFQLCVHPVLGGPAGECRRRHVVLSPLRDLGSLMGRMSRLSPAWHPGFYLSAPS